MLKDSLYTISSLQEQDESSFVAKVRLHAAHPIFGGHFPGQPILPGVCQLEMVKELLMISRKRPLRLTNASTIKYLKLVDPATEPELTFEISVITAGEVLKVNASSFLADGSVNFKLKASYI